MTLRIVFGALYAAMAAGQLASFAQMPAIVTAYGLVTGGRGITDITAVPDRLPPELTGLAARIACIADARPLSEYSQILAAAGLRTVRTESHDQAMTRMIDQIEARLNLLRMTASAKLTAAGVDLDAAPAVLAAARLLVRRARRRNPALGWSGWRTAGFTAGLVLVAAALLPPIASLAHTDFRGHMIQHLLIGMYAPLALVLAAPVTLLLRTLPAARARRAGPPTHQGAAQPLRASARPPGHRVAAVHRQSRRLVLHAAV